MKRNIVEPTSRSKPVAARLVRLFKHGRNQAVRIPSGWELPGEAAMVSKDGAHLILESAAKRALADVIAELRRRGPLPPEDRFPDIDGDLLPAEPVDL